MNEFLQVKKRRGEVVNFDMTKIIQAIQKAFFEVYPEEPMPEYAFAIAENIENRMEYDETIYNIEDIQDLVEYYLMQLDPPVARAYIRYRYRKVRELSSKILQPNLMQKILPIKMPMQTSIHLAAVWAKPQTQ